MIVDANILLYAVDADSRYHEQALAWVNSALNGAERVGLPWQTIGAFLRISTHPRLFSAPLTGEQAMAYVDEWLARDVTWVPPATERTVTAYRRIVGAHQVTGNVVTDAQLAALALEHGVPIVTADSDFARFPEVRWINPLVGP